jgi:uncharacterized protein (DUF1330 family)
MPCPVEDRGIVEYIEDVFSIHTRGFMAAYVVLNIDVTDPARYADYARAAGATLEQFGGRYLVRGGRAEALEGSVNPKRVVILEFPSSERAKAWWSSAEYSEPRRMRAAAAQSDTFIVDGI